MSPRDWYEFLLTHYQHAQPLLPDLRNFIHTKYIHEESTQKGKIWTTLADYPLSYEDFSAKRKLTFDPKRPEDQTGCHKPKTFINRNCGGSHFPVYMSAEEYTQKCHTSQHAILPSIHDNGWIAKVDK